MLLQGGSWTSFTNFRDFPDRLHVPVLTYSFSLEPGTDGAWTPALQNAVRYAFDQWSAVANLTFSELGSGSAIESSLADLAIAPIGSFGAGLLAIGIFPDPEAADQLFGHPSSYLKPEGDIYFDDQVSPMKELKPGGAGVEVFLHEIGHTLGLKHPEDEGLNGRFFVPSVDTRFTLMNSVPLEPPFNTGHAATPLLYDIQAIQHIYGANMSYHTGNDQYVMRVDGTQRAIWDAGGVDTLNLSASKLPLTFSLVAGPDSYARLSNTTAVAIAFDVTIENAIGGAFADRITGNEVDNQLEGRGGADTLDGAAGADTLIGGAGDDIYYLRAGDTVIEAANGGNDLVITLLASTTLSAEVERLVVDMSVVNATVIGNASSNDITGSAGNDSITGGSGNDTLNGQGGVDTLVGGPGDDVYRLFLNGDLQQAVELPGEGTDTLEVVSSVVLPSAFENATLIGFSAANLTGNALGNVLRGNAADNVLDGRDGADTLIGGGGNDSFVVEPGDVIAAGSGHDTAITAVELPVLPVGLDDVTLTGIAGNAVVGGSASANHFIGNSGTNVLNGGGGNDTLEGGRGDDFLYGGAGDDTLDGGAGADLMDGGAGFDTYIVSSSRDHVVEGALGGFDEVEVFAPRYAMDANVEAAEIHNDAGAVVTGNALDNTIISGVGADTLQGGGGADEFHFRSTLAVDEILDFQHGLDHLVLEGSDFTGAAFSVDLIYDAATGALSIDGVEFAQLGTGLEHPALAPSDIVIV